MSVAVKVCGLREPRHAAFAARRGAAWVGLVFFPRSPRHVRPEEARAIAAALPEGAVAVGVTVDADDDALRAAVGAGAGMLQLHGSEDPARTAEARRVAGVPVIRALGVAGPADLDAAGRFRDAADMLLFDARPPAGAGRPGGNARPFDWRLLRGRSFALPWILSGGLRADNVAGAVALSGANAVDVSSGVETAPGEKSEKRIGAFLDAARAAPPGGGIG